MIDQLIHDFDECLAAFKHIQSIGYEKPLHIVVKEYEPSRSLAANALMWVWNTEIAKYMNYNTDLQATAEDWHEYLVEQKWGMRFNPVTNKHTRLETKKFGVKKMTEHLEWIQQFAGEKGIPLTETVDYQLAMGQR